jgi:hypothetical protein
MVFEKKDMANAALMKERRKALSKAAERAVAASTSVVSVDDDMEEDEQDKIDAGAMELADMKILFLWHRCDKSNSLLHRPSSRYPARSTATLSRRAIGIPSSTCPTTRNTP